MLKNAERRQGMAIGQNEERVVARKVEDQNVLDIRYISYTDGMVLALLYFKNDVANTSHLIVWAWALMWRTVCYKRKEIKFENRKLTIKI